MKNLVEKKVKRKTKHHKPVLSDEVIKLLGLNKVHLKSRARSNKYRKVIVDATVGMGGHSEKIIVSDCFLLGIDTDEKALKFAEKRLIQACPSPLSQKEGCFKLIHGNFKDFKKLVEGAGYIKIDGVVFDLGVSTDQLTNKLRGFSFQNPDASLDMRLDTKNQAVTAADLVNLLRKDQLVAMFSKVMGFKESRSLSERIVEIRGTKRINTVGDLLDIFTRVSLERKQNLNLATLPFLALRIAVNSELENIKEAIPQAFSLLSGGGRMVVITFHSGEDRIIKEYFKLMVARNLAKDLTTKPVLAKNDEIEANPSARSAKLRAIEKI